MSLSVLLAVCPADCGVCYFNATSNRAECSSCHRHFCIKDDDRTCAGNYIPRKTVRCRAQWLRGRTSDFRLRVPGLESCAVGKFFTLHCSSSLSCVNEYLATDSNGHVYDQPSRINCSIWLDASQRSRHGV